MQLGMHGKRPGSPKKCTGMRRFCITVSQAWFRNYTVTERVLLCLGGKAVHHADIGLDFFEDSVFIVVEKINGDIRAQEILFRQELVNP